MKELSQSKADLESAGLKVTGFAYPYGIGGADATVLRQVKQYYSYARAVTPGSNTPIIKQYALKVQTVMSSTSIETMKSWIDAAIEQKQYLIILLHSVDDTGGSYSVSPAVLAELASYIQARASAGDLRTVTVQEGVASSREASWQPLNDPQASIQSDIVITNGQILWHLGSNVIDYLHDGYEWVQSGKLRYYALNGAYQVMYVPSHIALTSISPNQAIAEFTLSSVNGVDSVVSTVTLKLDSSLAEVHITGVKGTPLRLALAKDLARRFSIDEGLLMTDGWFESQLRTLGDNAQSMFAFESTRDLVRILTHSQRKLHSEYADYAQGEFRSSPISVTEFPYAWWIGGIVFDTFGLLAEAETGALDGEATFYTGTDASPKTGNTGVTLNEKGAVSIHFTPPAQGNYTLAVRHRGVSATDQYRYQVDDGEIFTRTVKATVFSYENGALRDLTAQDHIVRVSAVSGRVDVDYVLLVPTSRSANTPADIEFPADVADVARRAHDRVFLPMIR